MRRVLMTAAVAALVVSACGDSGSDTAGTEATPTVANTAQAIIGNGVGLDFTGSYEIADEATGAMVAVTVDGDTRAIVANGLPDHQTGAFPNANNPNSISEQGYVIELPVSPVFAPAPIDFNLPQPFGIALNGVPIDPFAAEFWERDPNSGWQYEALGGGIDLGVDDYSAHVQPSGAYHYHGIPDLYVDASPDLHGPLFGWAGDGFPIYVRYGYAVASDPGSPIVELAPSYRIKEGTRPSGPGGEYDGTFVEDYEFVAGLGDLDECNGRFGPTPEYPDGTYFYVLTDSFPYIPRCFMAPLADSFVVSGPGG